MHNEMDSIISMIIETKEFILNELNSQLFQYLKFVKALDRNIHTPHNEYTTTKTQN